METRELIDVVDLLRGACAAESGIRDRPACSV